LIKLPKTYQANGTRYKVKFADGDEGYFNSADQVIEIGKKMANDYTTIWAFIHECAEASAAVLGFRYKKTTEADSPIFVMTHSQFDNVMAEVARGVMDLMEANKK